MRWIWRGGEDERGDAGGGEQAGAGFPEALVVECPEDSAEGDDDDEGNEDAAKELELSVDAASLNVVGAGDVVATEEETLENVGGTGGEPAEREDHGDGEALADEVVIVGGNG